MSERLTTEQWAATRLDEVRCLDAFTAAMRDELASNAHKGDRPGWLSMTGRDAVAEVLYHAAKLSYALRQYAQGDGPADEVLEFAADVANCSMMVADIAGVLAVARPPSGTSVGRDLAPLAERPDYNANPTDWVRYANHLEDELAAKRKQHTAAADLLERRTDELDALRQLCKREGFLPDDLPDPSSFDRIVRERLGRRPGPEPEGAGA